MARLLDEPLLRGTLVAGGQGVDREVEWCIPYEGPDGDEEFDKAAVYASPGALAGTVVRAEVQRLARAGASMLVVPVAADESGLAQVAAAADEAGLPLLAVPGGATFRETSRLIATKVLAQATHVLEYGTRIHRRLGDVFARGGGLSALASAMAQESGTTVIIVGNNGEVLTEATPGSEDEGLGDEVVEMVVELVAMQDLAYATDDDHAIEVRTVELDEGPAEVVLAPVRVAGEPYGLLLLVEPNHPTADHDAAQHRVIAEHGVTITGSELLRMQSVRQAEERARNDFVHALLHGRFTDDLELAARAEHYHLPIEGRFAVYVVTTPAVDPDGPSGAGVGRDVERAVRTLAPKGLFTLSAVLGSMVVVVVQLKRRRGAERDAGRVTTELQNFGEQLHRALRQRLDAPVRVAYGGPFNGAAGIAQSYREARTAEGLARRVQVDPVCSYHDLRVFAAIEECATSSSGRAFAAEVLAPLKQLDGQTGNLEELVLVYIEEGGNLTATARRLHLHRNTVLYKLERASRAMQMDLRTTDAQFMIWLAFHVTALNDVTESLGKELPQPT